MHLIAGAIDKVETRNSQYLVIRLDLLAAHISLQRCLLVKELKKQTRKLITAMCSLSGQAYSETRPIASYFHILPLTL